MLKVLRPLRFIRRYEGLRISLDALMSSIRDIFGILIIVLFMFVLFGLIGVNFFYGMYNYCDYRGPQTLSSFSSDTVDTKWDCLNIGGEYLKRDSSFDDIVSALISLFPIS